MDDERLASIAPEDEALGYVDDLRRGGTVGFTDERLLIARGEEAPTSVELSSVESVEFQEFDWFDAILGVVLVGFGLASTSRNLALGVLFALAGVASLALTYRKRWRASVSIHSRPKPITLFPADGQGFRDAFDRALEDYRERHDLDPSTADAGRPRTSDGGE